MVSAEMAVPIENPSDYEVRDANRFLQADEILGYLAKEASSRVQLFFCMIMQSAYCLIDTSLAA